MDAVNKESNYSNENNLFLKDSRGLWMPDKVKSHPLLRRGYITGKILYREDRCVIKKAKKINNDDIQFIVKIVKKNKVDPIITMNEIRCLQRIRHHFVVSFTDAIETDDAFYLILERAENGDLLNYVNKRKRLSEVEGRRLFLQLLNAIEICHKYKICHRDIKLENILLDKELNLKLTDFDLAASDCNLMKLNAPYGSYGYVAPEILLESNYNGYKVDVWCAGICLYAMLCGRLPFIHMQQRDIYLEAINKITFRIPISNESRDLIYHMLNPDPNLRPSLRSVSLWKWIREPMKLVNTSKSFVKSNSNKILKFDYRPEHELTLDQNSASRLTLNKVSRFVKKSKEIIAKSEKSELKYKPKDADSIQDWECSKNLDKNLNLLQKRFRENTKNDIINLHYSHSARIFSNIRRTKENSHKHVRIHEKNKQEKLQSWKNWCNIMINKMDN
ncbi:testis-specific serine/threonine-protein kinase 2-like [Centruroides vittatus]|uniref:testis-specific serine/threonine-protein kinase 2-like n=1 Tax=Centruroides vittatus TaxID=120091 RepID=UPI0035100CD0